jgi:hypothetical protein
MISNTRPPPMFSNSANDFQISAASLLQQHFLTRSKFFLKNNMADLFPDIQIRVPQRLIPGFPASASANVFQISVKQKHFF